MQEPYPSSAVLAGGRTSHSLLSGSTFCLLPAGFIFVASLRQGVVSTLHTRFLSLPVKRWHQENEKRPNEVSRQGLETPFGAGQPIWPRDLEMLRLRAARPNDVTRGRADIRWWLTGLRMGLPSCERPWIRVEPGDFALARDGVTKSPVPRPSAAGSEPVHTLPFPTPERENVREVSRPQTGGCSKLLTLSGEADRQSGTYTLCNRLGITRAAFSLRVWSACRSRGAWGRFRRPRSARVRTGSLANDLQ